VKSSITRLKAGDGGSGDAAGPGKASGHRRPGKGRNSARRPHISLGGLDRFVGYVVRRAQVWIFQDFKRALKDADITPAQFSVMRVVAANSGIVQARVAEVLAIERARLVDMLDRLETRRLIERVRSPSDRRTHALHVTNEGAALLKRLEPLIEAHEQNVVERIGAEEKRELLRILGPMLR
jgi:DNA-binding MarR family transcriptional regulator